MKKVEWLLEGAIDTVKEIGYLKHIRGSHCKYCEFDQQCKPGLLKEHELSTKKYFMMKEEK
jgi:CRISPR/Cas system-associated exonuclease Cas4 (RecB family)